MGCRVLLCLRLLDTDMPCSFKPEPNEFDIVTTTSVVSALVLPVATIIVIIVAASNLQNPVTTVLLSGTLTHKPPVTVRLTLLLV